MIKYDNIPDIIETTINEEYDGEISGKKISPEKLKEYLNRFNNKAKDIITDKEKVSEILFKVKKLCDRFSRVPLVGEQLSNISELCSMVNDYMYGVYTKIPKTTVITFVAAMLYFISPIDLIPDIIPLIGYADDMFVFSLIMEAAKKDIKEYKKWKEQQRVNRKIQDDFISEDKK